jgi:quercetin dioxygenase-like cupin family protein
MTGDPRVVWMPGGVRTEIHLAGEDTGGAFCLLVDHPPAGWSLPAHRHANEAETIHVLEGDFDLVLDGARTRISAGETVHIPRGVIHSGANIGRRAGRRMVLFSPAGMEGFFLEAGASTPEDELDPAAALAVATRHGWEFPAPA